MLINTSRSFEELGLGEYATGFRAERLCTVPATEVALKHVGRPLPNAALLGGFAAISGRSRSGGRRRDPREIPAKMAEANIAAAAEAHGLVTQALREAAHA